MEKRLNLLIENWRKIILNLNMDDLINYYETKNKLFMNVLDDPYTLYFYKFI